MGCVFERGHGGARIQTVVVSNVLNDNDWTVISDVAQAGEAALYWDIGDTKQVHLEGTCGTLGLNTNLWVYIIGINHRSVNGVTFQGFKTTQTNGVSVALVDSKYDGTSTSGTKYFNMHHWDSNNYGGWKGCDLRYDVLGSTDIAPSGYGSTATLSRVGYDGSINTAINPINNTLMSCLPNDLRAVMQPMTIYTDNKGNNSNTSTNVTTSIDYLPLLAEFEVFGARTNATNTYEQNNQTQYSYYSSGNSAIKYKSDSINTSIYWWERSPGSSNGFCDVSNSGTASVVNSNISDGLAPMFLV